MELCGADRLDPLHEHVLFRALSDHLLSPAALQCRHGDEERHLSDRALRDVCGMLPVYEASDVHAAVWGVDDCVLRGVFSGGVRAGVFFGAEDVSVEDVMGRGFS